MLSDSQKLMAIAWKVDKENMSYGKFSAILTGDKAKLIYQEYENHITQRQEEEERRLGRKAKKKRTNKNG